MAELFGVSIASATISAAMWGGLAFLAMYLLERYWRSRRDTQKSGSTARMLATWLQVDAFMAYRTVRLTVIPLLVALVGFLVPDPRVVGFAIIELFKLDPMVSGILALLGGAVAGTFGVDVQIFGIDLVSPDYVVGAAVGVFGTVAVIRALARAEMNEEDDDD